MRKKVKNCLINDNFGLCRLFKLKRIVFGIWTFCFIFSGFIPLPLYSQFEQESKPVFENIEVNSFLKKKTIVIQINLSAMVIKDKKIKINIEPTYSEGGNLIDGNSVEKYKLHCELNTAGIKIKPFTYCSLSYRGDTMFNLLNGNINTLEFDLAKGLVFDKDLIFSLPFVIFADKEKKNTTADFKLSVIETPKELTVEAKTEPETSGTEKEYTKIDITSNTEKKMDNTGSAEGGSGEKEGEADPDSISTEPLEKMRNECKRLYDEVYSLFEKRKDSPVTIDQIQKYKAGLEKMRGRFDILYIKFSEVPKAEPIIASFDRYHEKTLEVLEALNKDITKNENKIVSDKDSEIAQSKKQNKTLQIILIILGTILLGIVLFVLMKFVMKKVKKNFEKKMKRKATLELNKQKFKVTQQKNKLRV